MDHRFVSIKRCPPFFFHSVGGGGVKTWSVYYHTYIYGVLVFCFFQFMPSRHLFDFYSENCFKLYTGNVNSLSGKGLSQGIPSSAVNASKRKNQSGNQTRQLSGSFLPTVSLGNDDLFNSKYFSGTIFSLIDFQ